MIYHITTGQKFGHLTAISPRPVKRKSIDPSLWLFECKCGVRKVMRRDKVATGRVSSCGCQNKTHGMSESRTYFCWTRIKQRCLNRKTEKYNRYGGRGITVCERWMKFENFLADMGVMPGGMSIERIDNDGNYEPGNCKWSSQKEQCNNQDRNRRISFRGETKTMQGWADATGVSRSVIDSRLRRGWSVDQALLLQSGSRNKSTMIKLTFNSVTKPLEDWATDLGISNSTLRVRIFRGWSIGRALTQPIQKRTHEKPAN